MVCAQAVFRPRCEQKATRHSTSLCIVLFLVLQASQSVQSNKVNFSMECNELIVIVGQSKIFHMSQIGTPDVSLEVKIVNQNPELINVHPEKWNIASGAKSAEYQFNISGILPGYAVILFEVSPPGAVNIKTAFLRIEVMVSSYINAVSTVLGWICFLAWTLSFYPQFFENYRRKSVVGLCFDVLALNIMGYIMYSLFNIGLYWSSYLQSQYFTRYPHGRIPVQLGDVFFSVSAIFATIAMSRQARIYERANQQVSTIARCILVLLGLCFLVTGILAVLNFLLWLDFLYGCNYIKLTITCIKFVPQALMNYRRKSTVGWSIGSVLCHFVGGLLSIVEMVLKGFNVNAWPFLSLVTKFGARAIGLSFDLLFLTQHYYLYRPKEPLGIEQK